MACRGGLIITVVVTNLVGVEDVDLAEVMSVAGPLICAMTETNLVRAAGHLACIPLSHVEINSPSPTISFIPRARSQQDGFPTGKYLV
jgi:hypothetical protein